MRYITLLIPFISACGMHVTSDPVKVEHTFTLNIEGIIEFCDKKYPNDDASFSACVTEIAALLNIPLTNITQ